MKKIIIGIALLFLFVVGGFVEKKEWIQNLIYYKDSYAIDYNVTMKRDLLCLMMAYPEYITTIDSDSKDRVYIVMKSGKRILYDDKIKKNFEDKLNNPDLQDMMEQVYPLSDITNLMPKDFDPGRIRVYSLLKEVYGGTREEIQLNLTKVKCGYRYYPFNRKNNASDALKSAMKELVALIEEKDIYSFVFPMSGTFNYRFIAGTNRLSPHSFGTAIDLRRDKKDYWKWASREEGQKRLDVYPREIVQAFEKNNFIWGGKWSHFDILHFEYRPELILKARYFSDRPGFGESWYDGLPSDDDIIKDYIDLINRNLK